jgi:hypothetical protein
MTKQEWLAEIEKLIREELKAHPNPVWCKVGTDLRWKLKFNGKEEGEME